MRLYIRNLDYEIDSPHLEKAFQKFGHVEDARIVKQGGVSRGIGYVTMRDSDAGRRAIAALDSTRLNGRQIFVQEAAR